MLPTRRLRTDLDNMNLAPTTNLQADSSTDSVQLNDLGENGLVTVADDNSPSTLESNTSSASGTQLCDGNCQTVTRVYLCVQCDGAFCDDCWAKQFPHKPGKIGADGLPHEKTDLKVVERLRDTLDRQDRTPEEQEKLHKNDEDTTWFGIARDEANMPIFQDYGRYAAILAESLAMRRRSRYPQLVSFIGQTGMISFAQGI
jgi:hypothetical protein